MSEITLDTVKLESELAKSVDEIFQELGLTSSDAIRLFYKQVLLRRGLPFAITLPSVSKEPGYEGWMALSQESLATVYGENEPEYTLSMLREENPEYEGR